jgi:Ca2+-dependent lipid-binding protein
VNLYVINATNLASRDIGSASDPYLEIKLDNKIKSTRDEY